ncbi:MAG TPA: SDR family oxidoreductase [Candidatus Binataceae bacterium]|nr:SDR family oxidoreductase [Candidatus Binataceae bacterium]
MKLTNSNIVILGGSTGIGFGTAKAAIAEGARVTIAGRSPEKLKAAKAELGNNVETVVLDTSDEAAVRKFFEPRENIDHIFVTPGTAAHAPRLELETRELRQAMDSRFLAALYAAKYGAPKIRGTGSITFMSGSTTTTPLPGEPVVTASCAAVEAFARSLALDLAPIRVNAITPGYIETPFLDDILGEQKQRILAAAAARLPAKRIGTIEEAAEGVLFLMKNEYVTGIALVVDGGYHLVSPS